ncbi:MAG: S16 family serine protease, partial [Nanoarchaeota archaeon]
MKRLIIILILVNMLLVPIVYSKEGHLTLLAVKETEDGFEGSTADMYLEIQPGEGRVFLDTFPLTKVDTQISTRFAKEVACNFLNRDCSEQDFIFTIKAESAIIAGPSAGAAAAVLTAILLEDLKPNESISITGTINSGGLIGNVGGIKEKIEAGTDAGLKKILIPKGEKIATNITQSSEKLGWEIVNDTLTIEITNKTKNIEKKINVTAYSKENVDIKEVSTLNDAIFEFTGKRFEEDGQELPVDNEYAKIMKSPSLDLCNRSDKL